MRGILLQQMRPIIMEFKYLKDIIPLQLHTQENYKFTFCVTNLHTSLLSPALSTTLQASKFDRYDNVYFTQTTTKHVINQCNI